MNSENAESQLALLGGPSTVTENWPAWPEIEEQDIEAVTEVLRSGKLSILRKEGVVAEFEEAFAEEFQTQHALSFASGTAALHAACFACGVAPGCEVLTPSYTWMSAITSILHANGVPVFCDVAPGALHIDPQEILRKATRQTKAVVVCHAWGIPAPMNDIMDAARARNLKVIEDASHAHGAKYRDRYVGTIGDIGCFSLQGTKALAASEGGMLVTDNASLYQRAMIPGHHDQRLKQCLNQPDLEPFKASGGYWKYRPGPLNMALGLAQLPRLKNWNSVKLENYNALERRLKEHSFLRFPELPAGSTRGFYGSPCLYDHDPKRVSRDTFLKALAAEGAVVFPGYDMNWYQSRILQDMQLFRQLWVEQHENGVKYQPLPPGSLPHTDQLVERTIVLPSWGRPAVNLVHEYSAAFDKVSRHMDVLAEYQRSGSAVLQAPECSS